MRCPADRRRLGAVIPRTRQANMLDTPSTVAVGPISASIPLPSFSERIVDAAATILDDGSEADYTVNAIVEVAKVGISTLYSRFPGKKDAVTETLMHREMTMVLAHASHDGVQRRGEKELRRVIAAMVTRALDRPAMTQMLSLEWYRLRLRKPDTPDHITLRVQQCIAWNTELERVRAKRAASEVVALIRSVIDAAYANGERDATALSDRLMGTVMHHLRNFT